MGAKSGWEGPNKRWQEPASKGLARHGCQIHGPVAGGWWMVQTPSWKLAIPDCCVCCMGPSETTTRVTYHISKEEACAWDFPLCHACAKHIRGRQIGMVITVAVAVAVIIAVVAAFGGWDHVSVVSVGVSLLMGILAAVASHYILSRLMPSRGADCASVDKPVGVGVAVALRRELADLDNKQCFAFKNEEYAKLFAEMNA